LDRLDCWRRLLPRLEDEFSRAVQDVSGTLKDRMPL
jgi:hypothetical protein